MKDGYKAKDLKVKEQREDDEKSQLTKLNFSINSDRLLIYLTNISECSISHKLNLSYRIVKINLNETCMTYNLQLNTEDTDAVRCIWTTTSSRISLSPKFRKKF